MNKKDILWRKLLDEEKQRLSSLPPDELRSMESYSSGVIKKDGVTIEYGIWHEIHKEDVKYSTERDAQSLSAQLDRDFKIPRPQREVVHTFVLQASRTIFLCFYKNYLVGFSLDNTGKVGLVSDDLLGRYD